MGKWIPDPLTPPLNAPIDLISILSNGERTTQYGETVSFDAQFDREIASFNARDLDNIEARRNLLQDRLKVSADQLCDEYKSNVMRKQARANFWLGTTSLLLGSAGALAKGLDTARALSGAAAFATGVRSEYNQDFYLDQTIAVVAKAIDKRQKEILVETVPARLLPIKQYSVVNAIDDMSRYHASCSLAGALALADKAIQNYDIFKGAEDAAKSLKKMEDLKSGKTGPQ